MEIIIYNIYVIIISTLLIDFFLIIYNIYESETENTSYIYVVCWRACFVHCRENLQVAQCI